MGAVNEIIHDGVTGFVRATPGDLAVAVIAAGQLDRLACRQVAAERFSTARMAADHVRLYESVAGARRAPARVA
jgi:glycosyltransferase involved in cell wall biosynthesis